MNLIWDETERSFPGYVYCKCTSKCIRKFKRSYPLKGYKTHKHLDPIRSEKIKQGIHNKMNTYIMSLMENVGDPLVSKINNLY